MKRTVAVLMVLFLASALASAKEKPKVVFSTTLEQVNWNSRLVRGNVEEEVGRLKSEPGKYISVGGPGLAASLMCYGLIDEYWLYVRPIILGKGKRMFPELEKVPQSIFGGYLMRRAYELGANSYLVKPVKAEDIAALGKNLKLPWLALADCPTISPSALDAVGGQIAGAG